MHQLVSFSLNIMSSSSNSSSPSSSPSASSSSSGGFERRAAERRNLRNLMLSRLQYLETVRNNPSQNQRQNRRKKKIIERHREEGQIQLYNDYFAEVPVYDERLFRRRFRMRRHLFLRLVHAAETSNTYFQQKENGHGRKGLTALQKCTAAIRMLAYGEAADRVDEYLRLGGSTARRSLREFVNVINTQFGAEYLRSPTAEDCQRILHVNEARGFPGMLGSIDCMHWAWKNCPVAWQGAFQGRSKKPSIILEAIASQDLWIWHCYFGTPGSLNDINVLHRSPVFDHLLNGRAPRVSYWVNGTQYNTGYYLTDGIYPRWATFMPAIRNPQTPKDKLFSTRQESVRKDVERAFGVLQARFAIIKKPALSWSEELLHDIMTACIIMHNMIVEDERDTYAGYDNANEYVEQHDEGTSTTVQEPQYGVGYILDLHEFVDNRNFMHSRDNHISLRDNLIENIWQRFSHLV